MGVSFQLTLLTGISPCFLLGSAAATAFICKHPRAETPKALAYRRTSSISDTAAFRRITPASVTYICLSGAAFPAKISTRKATPLRKKENRIT